MTMAAKEYSAPILEGIGAYYRDIRSIEIIEKHVEDELVSRYLEKGDQKAYQELVKSHLRLVAYIARSYKGYGIPIEDLAQEGNIGLMKAIQRFDPSKNVRIAQFASQYIRSEIQYYAFKNTSLLKIPESKSIRKLFYNLRSLKKDSGSLTYKDALEIADKLDVKVDEVIAMDTHLMTGGNISFSSGYMDDGEVEFSPEHFLCSDNDPSLGVDKSIYDPELIARIVSESSAYLNDVEQDILTYRLLADKAQSLRVLSQKHGVSQERIRQVEKNVIRKLIDRYQEAA